MLNSYRFSSVSVKSQHKIKYIYQLATALIDCDQLPYIPLSNRNIGLFFVQCVVKERENNFKVKTKTDSEMQRDAISVCVNA